MREHTIKLPVNPLRFSRWLDAWIEDVNELLQPGGRVKSAVYYQFTKPDYLDVLKTPPYILTFWREKRIRRDNSWRDANRIHMEYSETHDPEWITDRALSVEISEIEGGINLVIELDVTRFGIRLEDFVLAIESVEWVVSPAAGAVTDEKNIDTLIAEWRYHLNEEHKQIFDLWREGKTGTEINRIMGTKGKTVYNLISSWRTELETRYTKDIGAKILPYRTSQSESP